MSARAFAERWSSCLPELFWPTTAASRERSESGAALVEFTILMPVLFLILFGIIEFGSMIWMQNDMTNAAREGARKAAVRGGTTAQAASTACGCLQGLGPTFTITPTRACTIPAGATTGVGEVTVNVVVNKSDASLMNTFFSFSGGNLTASTWGGQIGASVTMRQEDNCAAAEAPGPTSCSTAGGTLSCN
ncbi:MAG TPA: TadE family protein [Xanthobacteraceae bacterium]|nr:TadE family protein [Xanthobacteraceae bacterium]